MTDDATPRPHQTPVRVLPLMLRLAAACVVIGGLVALARPLLGPLLARVARNVVTLTSGVPHLAELAYGAGSFRLVTRLADGELFLDAGPYWFVVAFPMAFAAALPGVGTRDWWGRLGLTTAVSFGVAALLLAVTVDGQLVRELWSAGLRVNPRWRDQAVRATMRRFWEVALLAYPFAACAWLAWVGWVRPARGGSTRGGSRWAAPLLVVVTAAAGACDLVAERRLDLDPEELYARLRAYNPDLGLFLLRRGAELEAAGRHGPARRHYEMAARYPAQATEARRGLERVEAAERGSRGGGRRP